MHLVLMMMLLGAAQDQEPVLPSVSLIESQIEGMLEADRQMVIAHLAEIKAWVKADEKYLDWADKWFNKCRPGMFRHCTGERLTEPQPPDYLASECVSVFDDPDGLYTQACQMLRNYHDDFNTQRDRRIIAVKRADKIVKTSLLKYVHFDFGMTASESQTWGLYAPVGMHIAIPVGKFNLFVAPGVMMLRMMRSAASGGGEKYWEFAYDLGGGWQIMKLRLPGMERESKIFVNVMRVYVPTGPQNLARASLNMMGFSLNLP